MACLSSRFSRSSAFSFSETSPDAGALATVDFRLVDPFPQRVRRAANLRRHQRHRRPARRVIALVIQNHPHRTGANLGENLLVVLLIMAPSYLEVGASGKPGAVHPRALRRPLLRARRDGEPHQGGARRPFRRPHFNGDDARQPVASVVRVDGLRSALRLAPYRPRPHPIRHATCGTIRLKLLKLGALVKVSARRVKIAFASACPSADEWRLAAGRLAHARGSPA